MISVSLVSGCAQQSVKVYIFENLDLSPEFKITAIATCGRA